MNKKFNAKQLQLLCEAILEAKGQSYKDWLYEKQNELLLENGEFIAGFLIKGGKNNE